MKQQWYSVEVFLHHQGAGSDYSVTAYVFAQDVLAALERSKDVPGAKKYPSGRSFPSVFPLDAVQSSALETEIIQSGLPLCDAKFIWYVPIHTVERYNIGTWYP